MFVKRTLRFLFREIQYSQVSKDTLRVTTRNNSELIDAIPLTTKRGTKERQKEIATIISNFKY